MYNGEPNIKGQIRIVEYATGRDVTDQWAFVIRQDLSEDLRRFARDDHPERYYVWPKYKLTKDGVPNRNAEGPWVKRYWGVHGAPYFILDEERENKANPIRERIAELNAQLGAAKRELANVYREPDKQEPARLTGCTAVDRPPFTKAKADWDTSFEASNPDGGPSHD